MKARKSSSFYKPNQKVTDSFRVHVSRAGDVQAVREDAESAAFGLAAEGLHEAGSVLRTNLQETRLACDLFSRSLRKQNEIFERELKELQEIRAANLPPPRSSWDGATGDGSPPRLENRQPAGRTHHTFTPTTGGGGAAAAGGGGLYGGGSGGGLSSWPPLLVDDTSKSSFKGAVNVVVEGGLRVLPPELNSFSSSSSSSSSASAFPVHLNGDGEGGSGDGGKEYKETQPFNGYRIKTVEMSPDGRDEDHANEFNGSSGGSGGNSGGRGGGRDEPPPLSLPSLSASSKIFAVDPNKRRHAALPPTVATTTTSTGGGPPETNKLKLNAPQSQLPPANQTISFWHGVPLCSCDPLDGHWGGSFHFACKMSKHTTLRRKVDTCTVHNPLVAMATHAVTSTENRSLQPAVRFNLGVLPRTWLNPNKEYFGSGRGDNALLECVEVGLRSMQVGDVRRVKVLGVLVLDLSSAFSHSATGGGGGGGGGDDAEAQLEALFAHRSSAGIDEQGDREKGDDQDGGGVGKKKGETKQGPCCFKLVALDESDRWASEVGSVEDLERLRPGTLELIRKWFMVDAQAGAGGGHDNQQQRQQQQQQQHAYYGDSDENETPASHNDDREADEGGGGSGGGGGFGGDHDGYGGAAAAGGGYGGELGEDGEARLHHEEPFSAVDRSAHSAFQPINHDGVVFEDDDDEEDEEEVVEVEEEVELGGCGGGYSGVGGGSGFGSPATAVTDGGGDDGGTSNGRAFYDDITGRAFYDGAAAAPPPPPLPPLSRARTEAHPAVKARREEADHAAEVAADAAAAARYAATLLQLQLEKTTGGGGGRGGAVQPALPLFAPKEEAFLVWGLVPKAEAQRRQRCADLGLAVEALLAHEAARNQTQEQESLSAASAAAAPDQPNGSLSLRDLRKQIGRSVLEAAAASSSASSPPPSTPRGVAAGKGGEDEERQRTALRHAITLASNRPGSTFQWSDWKQKRVVLRAVRVSPSFHLDTAESDDSGGGGHGYEEEEKYALTTEAVAATVVKLTSNAFHGVGVASAVLKRAHLGWRALLKVHHPLHPLNSLGKPAVLERQVELCAEVGATWVKGQKPAPPSLLEAPLPPPLAPFLSSPSERRSRSKKAGDPEADSTKASSSVVRKHHGSFGDEMEESEAPPLAWLLWVTPPSDLDIAGIKNDGVFVEAFVNKERERAVEVEDEQEDATKQRHGNTLRYGEAVNEGNRGDNGATARDYGGGGGGAATAGPGEDDDDDVGAELSELQLSMVTPEAFPPALGLFATAPARFSMSRGPSSTPTFFLRKNPNRPTIGGNGNRRTTLEAEAEEQDTGGEGNATNNQRGGRHRFTKLSYWHDVPLTVKAFSEATGTVVVGGLGGVLANQHQHQHQHQQYHRQRQADGEDEACLAVVPAGGAVGAGGRFEATAAATALASYSDAAVRLGGEHTKHASQTAVSNATAAAARANSAPPPPPTRLSPPPPSLALQWLGQGVVGGAGAAGGGGRGRGYGGPPCLGYVGTLEKEAAAAAAAAKAPVNNENDEEDETCTTSTAAAAAAAASSSSGSAPATRQGGCRGGAFGLRVGSGSRYRSSTAAAAAAAAAAAPSTSAAGHEGAVVPTGALAMVCECPVGTRSCLRVETRTAGNPIKQDTRSSGTKLRVHPRPLPFNVGFLPRTWQDPSFAHPLVVDNHGNPYTRGVNEPLLAIEVGQKYIAQGVVRPVKLLGVIPVLTDIQDKPSAAAAARGGSSSRSSHHRTASQHHTSPKAAVLEWACVVVDEDDLWARELQCVDDLEALCPGALALLHSVIRDRRLIVFGTQAEVAEATAVAASDAAAAAEAAADSGIGSPPAADSGVGWRNDPHSPAVEEVSARVKPYAVVGGVLDSEFAVGIVRTAFHCYKRLLSLNWAAAASEAKAEEEKRKKSWLGQYQGGAASSDEEEEAEATAAAYHNSDEDDGTFGGGGLGGSGEHLSQSNSRRRDRAAGLAEKQQQQQQQQQHRVFDSGKTKVPPSVWLLNVPEEKEACLEASLLKDEVALLQLSSGLGLDESLHETLSAHAHRQQQLILHRAGVEERMDAWRKRQAIREKERLLEQQDLKRLRSLDSFLEAAADRGLAQDEAERTYAESVLADLLKRRKEEEADAHEQAEAEADILVVEEAQAYMHAQSLSTKKTTTLFRDPITIEHLRMMQELGRIVFVDCRPPKAAKSKKQAVATAALKALGLKHTQAAQQAAVKAAKTATSISAYSKFQSLTLDDDDGGEVKDGDRAGASGGGTGGSGGALATMGDGAVPIWLDIPGFWNLKRFVGVRENNPSQLHGYKVVALDVDGRRGSMFMANQARYHPRLARRTSLLILSEKVARWFMNPNGRYLKWLLNERSLEAEVALWCKRAKAQKGVDDGGHFDEEGADPEEQRQRDRQQKKKQQQSKSSGFGMKGF